MLVGTYEYNFDRPSTGNNTLRVYDFFGSNSPELAQGELYIERAAPHRLGFVLDLNTANLAQVQYGVSTVYWKVPGRAGACPQSPCGWLDPTRAYLDYTLPLGTGILLTAGTQLPLIGNEAIPSWQNYNLFQSIGYVFHASPFNVTGLRAHYTFNDSVGLTLGLNNGWDSLASSYPLQTFEGQLSLNPDAATLSPDQRHVWAARTDRRQSAVEGRPARSNRNLDAAYRRAEHHPGGDRGSSGQQRPRADSANRGTGTSVEPDSR